MRSTLTRIILYGEPKEDRAKVQTTGERVKGFLVDLSTVSAHAKGSKQTNVRKTNRIMGPHRKTANGRTREKND